jgi:DNA-binding transcriptional ArsR family regulator
LPPEFLRLAGHPVRWRLLDELSRSDRRVDELTGLVGELQSLVSFHLRLLRGAGQVSARRSTADGRAAYSSLDLARCGDLLAAVYYETGRNAEAFDHAKEALRLAEQLDNPAQHASALNAVGWDTSCAAMPHTLSAFSNRR